MKLPQIAINNYQFVSILVMLCVVVGLRSFLNMPRAEDPAMEVPFYSIVAVYPGVSPQDIEELIVDPVEDALNELEEIESISTRIGEGVANILVEAEFGVDIEDKNDEIVAKINAVTPELSDNLYSIEVNRFNPLDVIIMQLALVSETSSYRQLELAGEALEDRLNAVNGVRSVELHAFPAQQVRIALDFEKISTLRITLPQIVRTLAGNNANMPAGDLKIGAKSFTVKTSGGYKSLEDIRRTVVGAFDGHIIRLGQIADVRFDYEDERYIGRFNGRKAIFLSATQKEGVNLGQLTEAMTAAIDEFRQNMPTGMDLHYTFLQGLVVASRINGFFFNLLQGVLLVGVVVIIFLGGRAALIVMTAIPSSIIIAIWALDLSGFGLQQISIVGLVIALGLLVDNSIVVIENIRRYVREGHQLREAAYQATSEVGWAIVSATVTTVLAFFPLTQLGGGTGEYLQTMPLIVTFCLTASLLLALTYTPILAGKFLKDAPRQASRLGERLMQTVIQHHYRTLLTYALKKPFVILGIAALCFVGGIMLFPIVGVSFFPNADKALLLIDINTPDGTNINRTDEAAGFVEGILDTLPDVKNYTTNVGHGNPQIYYNRIPVNYRQTHAQILVNLYEWNPDRFYPLISTLRDQFDGYPGARITVSELKNGPPVTAPIEIRILGDHLDTLKTIAADIERMIDTLDGTINADNPLSIDKTDLRVHIRNDKAGLLGLAIPDIDMAVRVCVSGLTVSEVNFEDGYEYDMVVRMPFEERTTIDDLENVHITSVTGGQVPLTQAADIRFERSASRIGHYNLKREATVTADVLDGYNTMEMTNRLIRQLEAYPFSPGYTYDIGGEYESQQESFGDMGQILMVALIGIFAVLVLQFKSVSQPFVVFSAIPLAFTGSICALFLTGFSFSFFAFVGFTSLVGIVVNNSIILVDYTNQLMIKGLQLREAIHQACETRFTPIVLTTLTTIVGLLPLTLTNSNLWSPLGWTIIGGMVSSTVLTLVIVPILLRWFSPETR